MRAREFVTEDTTLPPEQADPMNHVFVLPGVNSSDPYQIYRLGVAIAVLEVMLAQTIPYPTCPNGHHKRHLAKML
jgi:hypothetical protein